MTPPTMSNAEIYAEHQRRNVAYADALYDTIREVMGPLGVVAVHIVFSGCGDSGQIDDVIYVAKTNEWNHVLGMAPSPSENITFYAPPPVPYFHAAGLLEWNPKSDLRLVSISDALTMLGDVFLDDIWGFDYYNNEGGGGTLIVRFDKKVVEPEFYVIEQVSHTVTVPPMFSGEE